MEHSLQATILRLYCTVLCESTGGLLEWVARATGNDFKPCKTMYIAALGDPQASSGMGAEEWGLWRVDPGPPGVYLNDFSEQLEKTGGVAPAGWQLDEDDWWVEEYGRIMDKPEFPIPCGKYIVTGQREDDHADCR